MRRNDGFTLIELLVTISTGALVTFAAMSLLLLGARVQYNSTQEAEEQQTIRIVMSLLEEMAGKGSFNYKEETDDIGSWRLLNCADPDKHEDDDHNLTNDTVVFEYVKTKQSIYRGKAADDNAPLLDGLNNATVLLNAETNLVSLGFETDWGGNYATNVYCRTGKLKEAEPDVKNESGVQGIYAEDRESTLTKRIDFLDTLAGEYGTGNNTGRIVGDPNGTYYSQWYIGSENWGTNGWNKDTPWCACFLSWAAVKNDIVGENSPFVFANVDAGMAAFKAVSGDGDLTNGDWKSANDTPSPGDYVFFDWSEKQKDPAHVGVVLDTVPENGKTYIYTIEGNSSGRVAVRKYAADSKVIMGYGVLPGF